MLFSGLFLNFALTKKNNMKTNVEFYVDGENDVLAVFPDIRDGVYVLSYSHIGQHGQLHTDYLPKLRKATPQEYAELKTELVCLIGYQFD